MTSIRVLVDEDQSLELPAAAAPALGLKVWPPESLEAVLQAHARRNRFKLHPGEAYTWTGKVKALKEKWRSRKGQRHHNGRPKGHGPIQCRENIRSRATRGSPGNSE